MTEEQLLELVEKWDELEYEEELYGTGLANDPEEYNDRKGRENRHEDMYKKLKFLEKHFFKEYDLNKPHTFSDVFLRWIGQFNGNIEGVNDRSIMNFENRYAFILAHKIIFFSRDQIISLQKEVWDKIKRELLMLGAKQNNGSPIDLMFEGGLISEQLKTSVFVPLSDSSHWLEFRHLCLPSGIPKDMVITSVDILIPPNDSNRETLIKNHNEKYGTKKNLFIIEDFSGSGTTIKKNVEFIIKNYPFENIYFCPYIISDKAKLRLEALEEFARGKNKIFKVLCGIHMGGRYSILDDSLEFWREEEKRALQEISKKYFELHFKENGYLYMDHGSEKPVKATPFGFRNCALAIVLFSNCPNNSLPIIWSENGDWNPLFKRHERFIRRLGK